jgi:hypothetical protein
MTEEKKTALTEIEAVATRFTTKVRDLVVEILGDVLGEVKLDKEEEKKEEAGEKKEEAPAMKAASNVRSIR